SDPQHGVDQLTSESLNPTGKTALVQLSYSSDGHDLTGLVQGFETEVVRWNLKTDQSIDVRTSASNQLKWTLIAISFDGDGIVRQNPVTSTQLAMSHLSDSTTVDNFTADDLFGLSFTPVFTLDGSELLLNG